MKNTEKKSNALYNTIKVRVVAKHPDWTAKRVNAVSYSIFKSSITAKAQA